MRISDWSSDVCSSDLLIATGGRSRRLTIPGSELQGIHAIRSYEDMAAFRPDLLQSNHLAIIGGGYIGLETAAVARSMGLEVPLIQRSARQIGRASCRESVCQYV